MKLEESVKELLLFNDCVIVPRFGAFVANYNPAHILEEQTSHFAPPSKHLVFNKKLTHNDGLLLDFIVQKEGVSFEDASALVQKQVWDIEREIKSQGLFEFSDLGIFSATDEGALSFDTLTDQIDSPDSFGLGTFNFKPLNNRPTIRIKKERTLRDLVYRAANNKLLRPAMFILPLVAAAGLMKPYFEQSIQTSSLDMFSATETVAEQTHMPETTVKAIDKHYEESNHQRSELAYTEPEYHIIVGSFQEQENAVQFMNKQIFSKVKAELVFSSNLYRVSVGHFSNKDTATKRLIEMRVRNRELKDAWVFTMK